MTNKNVTTDGSAIWNLTSNTAELHAAQLVGTIDLGNSLSGLHQLRYRDTLVEGLVLGVGTSGGLLGQGTHVDEAFVRGDDLVARYQETDERPFSLQIYWTVTSHENGALQIDSLLSIETRLLESFPEVRIKSELPCEEVWSLSSQAAPVRLPAGESCQGSDVLVLRSANEAWSYAEMTHPKDTGNWTLDFQNQERGFVQRTLGGTFLEKGVIRRSRIRGVFLPRENDLQLAAKCLEELASEAPPLTT